MAGDPFASSLSDDADMRDESQQLPPPPAPPAPPVRPLFSVSLVCQSNVNRSMEAHRVLADQHWPITLYSYGVGQPARHRTTPSNLVHLDLCQYRRCLTAVYATV